MFAAAGVLCHRACATPDASADAGWTSLFNGKDLTGWYTIIAHGAKNDDTNHLIQVDDGMIHVYESAEENTKQPFGYVITEKEYSDYDLRFRCIWGAKKFKPRNGPKSRATRAAWSKQSDRTASGPRAWSAR